LIQVVEGGAVLIFLGLNFLRGLYLFFVIDNKKQVMAFLAIFSAGWLVLSRFSF